MENFAKQFEEKLREDKTVNLFLENSLDFNPEQFKIGKVFSDQFPVYKAVLELCLDYKGDMSLFEGTKAKLDIGICDTDEFSTKDLTDVLKKNGACIEFIIYRESQYDPSYKLSTTLNEDSRIEASQKFLQKTYKKL